MTHDFIHITLWDPHYHLWGRYYNSYLIYQFTSRRSKWIAQQHTAMRTGTVSSYLANVSKDPTLKEAQRGFALSTTKLKIILKIPLKNSKSDTKLIFRRMRAIWLICYTWLILLANQLGYQLSMSIQNP